MTTINNHFNPHELCSRKLWQLVTTSADISSNDLQNALSELAARRHYLEELKRIGKLSQYQA